MFGIKHMASCSRCRTVFKTKCYKTLIGFREDHHSKCPCCGGYLCSAPLMPTKITPPPELKTYPLYTRTVDLDEDGFTLDYTEWPRIETHTIGVER